MFSRVEIVTVPVSDQQASKRFYCETLGFEVMVEADFGEGRSWLQIGLSGGQTSLALVNWFETMLPGSLRGLVLDVSDIQATRAALAARGVAPSPVRSEPWGDQFTFPDPDGNVLVALQRRF